MEGLVGLVGAVVDDFDDFELEGDHLGGDLEDLPLLHGERVEVEGLEVVDEEGD